MRKLAELEVSPVERELLFQSWCKENRVDLFLFDGDDTLWPIHKTFNEKRKECADFLATEAPIYDSSEWNARIQASSDKLFDEVGVNPKRWNLALDEVTKEIPVKTEAVAEAKRILRTIYETPLQLFPGVAKMLSFVNNCGKEIGIVTHAGQAWTRRKYNWMNLGQFLPWDNVYIVDENGKKTDASWLAAMDYFRRKPQNCLIIGDSPMADINPSARNGVKHLVLVENEIPRWKIHNEPVPENTIQVASAAELVNLGSLATIKRRAVYRR